MEMSIGGQMNLLSEMTDLELEREIKSRQRMCDRLPLAMTGSTRLVIESTLENLKDEKRERQLNEKDKLQ